MALVTGFVGSPEPWQADVRPVERLAWSAHIEHVATWVDQQTDPAGFGDLFRCLTSGRCVHGAIVFRDRIRDKDKDPSFSAKQPRDAAIDDMCPAGGIGWRLRRRCACAERRE